MNQNIQEGMTTPTMSSEHNTNHMFPDGKLTVVCAQSRASDRKCRSIGLGLRCTWELQRRQCSRTGLDGLLYVFILINPGPSRRRKMH